MSDKHNPIKVTVDSPIKYECQGFVLELKDPLTEKQVLELLEKENKSERNHGLKFENIEQFPSTKTEYQITLASDSNSDVKSVFNFAAHLAEQNPQQVVLIEPVFDFDIPKDVTPKVETEGAVTKEGVFDFIGDYFKELLGKQSEAERIIEKLKVADTWALELISADKKRTEDFKEEIVIAHPDTGYLEHSDISAKVHAALSRNFYDPVKGKETDPGLAKDSTHGLGTASLIVGEKLGVAPKAKIVPLRTSNSVVYFRWSTLAKAIDHAISIKAHIISMSLGGPFKSRAVMRAIDRAIDAGIIVIAAAGNYTGSWVIFPANYDPVIAVAACGPDRKPWKNSAHGKKVAVTAPGFGTVRAFKKGNDESFGAGAGTSYATAHVAGVAALWLQYHGLEKLNQIYPGRKRQQAFKKLLKSPFSCIDVQTDDPNSYGGGIINLEQLLQQALIPLRDDQNASATEQQDATDLVIVPNNYKARVDEVVQKIRTRRTEVANVRELELAVRSIVDPKTQNALDKSVRVGTRTTESSYKIVGGVDREPRTAVDFLLMEPDLSPEFKASFA